MAQENFIITNGAKNIMSLVLVNIEKQLFKQPNILLNRYADMIKNYDSNKYSITDKGCEVQMINSSSFRFTNCVHLKNFGLDIPLLLEQSNNSSANTTYICLNEDCPIKPCDTVSLNNQNSIQGKTRNKTIMIITQNPKRIETPNGLLSLSSPFGIHCMDYRRNPRKGFMTGFINLLFTNPNIKYVYITDAIKLYGECSFCNLCTFCNSIDNDSICINIVSKDILSAEINSVNPDYIIAFGSESSNMVAEIYGLKQHDTFGQNGLEIPIQQITINNKHVNVIYHKYPRAQKQATICNRQIYKNLTDCNFFDLK